MASSRVSHRITATQKKPLILDGCSTVSIFVAAGAKGIVFYSAQGKKPITIDVNLGTKSELTYIFLSHGTDAALHSTLGASASMQWHLFTIGGEKAKYDLHSDICGANATSQINWTFTAKKSQQQTIDVRNVFHAKNGGGEIYLKGIAEDKAHVKANGMIEIGLKGGGTETYLTEEVLMLDASAKVDAIPGLEIKTNDVKASHSATVSRVTPEQLFYLQSRGLPEETARKLYIDGFIGEMIEKVPEGLRERTRLSFAHDS